MRAKYMRDNAYTILPIIERFPAKLPVAIPAGDVFSYIGKIAHGIL